MDAGSELEQPYLYTPEVLHRFVMADMNKNPPIWTVGMVYEISRGVVLQNNFPGDRA